MTAVRRQLCNEIGSYSEVLRDSIEKAVVDRAKSDGSITPAYWRLINDAMAGIFLEVMRENSGPVRINQISGSYHGHIKLIK